MQMCGNSLTFRRKIYISSLRIYISSLKMHIFNLRIYIFSLRIEFFPGAFREDVRTDGLARPCAGFFSSLKVRRTMDYGIV